MRSTACTAINQHSSRSHALLSVRLQPAAGDQPASVLHLVDLAGALALAAAPRQP